MMNEIKTSELFDVKTDFLKELFTNSLFPWDILPKIKGFILEKLSAGIDGYTLLKDGVIIGENVKIHPSAVIDAPCIIGKDTEIRPGAYIRGSVIIGEGCVIGNSTELKNSVLLDGVQVPHYNYVGDSVLGNKAHMGAGSICSNLKSDKSNVTIKINGEKINTGMRKIGAILADGADIGCGCVLNPGTVIGKSTSVYPLTSLRGVYPANSIVKAANKVIKRT